MANSKIRLPKVTQYVRNVGKSVAFASINAVKSNMEGIKGFAEDNEDVFVEIYSGAKNYRETLKKAQRSIKDSNLYKAIEYGAKNMIEDAKTGNFYNDRTSDVSESALGLDDESLGLDFDYEVSSGSSQSSGSKYIADTFNDAMKSSTIGTTTAVAKGTDMVVRSTKASTTILSSQIEKSTATIHSGLGAVYNSVNQINQFLNGPMMAHLENSRTYYDNSLKLMQEQHAMMKEMLEMQRNLYSTQAKQYSTSRLDQSISANGMMNLRGYGKVVKSNLDDILSMYGLDMLSNKSGMNVPLIFAAAPFKILMDNIFSSLMPGNIKKNLKSFDNIASGMFGQFIGKMNKNKNNMSNGFLNLLGQLFGIDIENKKSINTSKYNKGAVAFDGITRKTIIEVIPGYLARIEAALTGSGERHYDPHSGKWKTARQIGSEFEKERINAIESANRSITYDIASDSRFQSKGYQKAIRKFKEQIYEDGYFDVGLEYKYGSKSDANGRRSRSSSGDAYKKYGFKDKKAFDSFLSMLSDETIAGLASSNQRAKQARSRKLQEYEDMGSIFNVLFNDSYNDGSTKSGTYSDPSKFATGSLLNRTTDKYGKNVFYYLREILKGINSRWRSSTRISTPSGNHSNSVKVRRSHSREYSTSSESEGDSGSDDEWDSVDADLSEQENKAAEEREKKNAAKNWVDDNLKKSSIGKYFKDTINGVSKIISSPLKFMDDLLEQANNSMFSLMFGNAKTFEVRGKKVDNVFEFIIELIKVKFDELGNFIKTRVFNPILDLFKEKVKPWTEPIWNELKGIGRAAKIRVKRGLSNTFGKAGNYIMSNLPDSIANKVSKGGVATADEIEAAAAYDNDGIEYDSTLFDIGANARGARYVTKRGLTMISPGEMIIPASFNRKKQNKMLALEKRDRKRIINAIGLNAAGNIQTDDLKKKLSQIYAENTGDNKAAKVGAGGIAGFGAGLITGFNPLLAALTGAGLSVLDNSDTLKNIVFGEVVNKETGDRKGGIISKKIQDTFKKYAPDMGDFGIAGGVLGLITPFGPLMGAAIGAGIGFLKNSEGFKKFVFGNEGEDDGLISKKAYDEFKDRVKKAAPKMLLGAGAGILAGPFGLLGNAALGAGFGLISTTETFQNFLYGEADENGERHGGVVDAFKTGFLEPAKEKFLEFVVDLKEYSKKHIFEPMKNFWKPVNQMLKNVIQSTGDKIKDSLNDMFERTLGLPLHDFLQEKIFKPMGKIMFGILKAPYKVGRAIVSAPFRALGGIGNSMRASQIRRGTAYDMTASERLAWRDQHKIRFNPFNRFADKRLDQDRMLADMDENQLNDIFMNSKAGLSSYKSLQDATGIARSNVGKEVSKYFNTATADARNRFNKVGYSTVNKLVKIAQTESIADTNEFIDNMKDLTDDEKSELKQKIAEKVKDAERANQTMELAKSGTNKLDKQLSKVLGYKVNGRKDRRKIMRSAEAELKARRKISEKANESPEVNATNNFAEIYNKKSNEIIGLFKAANQYLEVLVNPTAKSTAPPGSDVNKAKKNTDNGSTTDTKKSEVDAITNAMDVTKDAKKKSKSPFGKLLSKLGIGNASIDEDSKAGKELKAEAEEDDARADKHLGEAEKSTSILTKIKEALIGKKDSEDKGFLGKLWKGLGAVGKWLGIGGLVLTGTSLIGHLSQWFKVDVWPNMKSMLFGTKDANGNVTSQGVLGKVGSTISKFLFGEEGTNRKGLLGGARDTIVSLWTDKIAPWFETKINSIATWISGEGGLKGIFINHIIPGFINGLGYAVNNLLGPAIGALLKAAPSLLAGLGKALLEGIKIAFINREVKGTRNKISDNGASKEYAAALSSSNSAIESADNTGTVSKIKVAFGNLGASFKSGSGSYEIDNSSLTGSSSNKDKNSRSSKGIMGLLGQTKRTNTVEFDEDGNIITDYTRFNTTDSLASYFASAAGRNFVKGLGGNFVKSKSFSKLGKDALKSAGNLFKPGIFSKAKGVFGLTKTVGKAGYNGVGMAGKYGGRLNTGISNAATDLNYVGKFSKTAKGMADSADNILLTPKGYKGKYIASNKSVINIADDVVKSSADNVIAASADNVVAKSTKKIISEAADSSTVKNGILNGITNIFKNIVGDGTIIKKIVNAAKTLTGKEVTEKVVKEAIEKIGKKLGESLVAKATTSALKGIGNVIAKFSPLTLATFVIDFVWGFDNADTILGVAKGTYDINLGHKCICGLVNMLTNFFTLGLLPADVIMDICIDYLFPVFGLDTESIRAARAEAQAAMDKWNKENPDDTYDNLQDFNNKDKWWFKAKKGLAKGWENTKTAISNGWNAVKETTSKAFKSVGSAITNAWNGAKDLGTFIKDVTPHIFKSAFDPEYEWDIDSYLGEEDPLGGAKKLIYHVIKIPVSAVGMVGRIGKGIIDSIKKMINNAKDGAKDASTDVAAVKSGQYTIFSREYWSSNNIDNGDNPISIIGSITGFISRLLQAPTAMLGYVVTKIKQGFVTMINGAKEGITDASKDVDAVKSGKYTIFNKEYWTSENTNDNNPISTLGSIFGTISRVLQSPSAMLGYVGCKIRDVFTKMIDGAKDVQSDTNNIIKKADSGEVSVFSKNYWKITVDEDNPLGLLGKVSSFIQRLLHAPIAIVKGALAKGADALSDAGSWIAEKLGGGKGKVKSAGSKVVSDRAFCGSGHIYQSNGSISNIPYGDSTIGKSGCAPVAAANILNNVGRGMADVKDAARYAEQNGMTVPGGGTDIAFFNSYLGSKGISTKNTSNKNSVINALNNGNQVVMLGKDTYNEGAPFGTSPHFITAKGISRNGNIVVEDPDLPYSNIEYHPNTVMKSMITSVIANTNNRNKHKKRNGRKRYNRRSNIRHGSKRYTKYIGFGNAELRGAQSVIDIAKSQIGVTTKDAVKYTKARWAYYSEKYNSDTVSHWNPDFIWWVFNQAGAISLLKEFTSDAEQFLRYFESIGRLDDKPEVGDIIFLNKDYLNDFYLTDYMGIVYEISNDFIVKTIEGDINGKVGYGSYNLVTDKRIKGFGHPEYPYVYDPFNVVDMGKIGDSTNYESIATSSTYDSETTSKTSNLFTAIGNLGKSMIKAVYGNDAYNAIYESFDTNNGNISSASNYIQYIQNAEKNGAIDMNTGIISYPTSSTPESYTVKQIWDALRNKGYSKAGTAGIMGNMKAESNYRANNLQNSYSRKWGISDEEYSNMVSNGSYGKDKFIYDKGGYGLVQFTHNSLKRGLYKNTVERGIRVDNMQAQIDTVAEQLSEKKSLNNCLKTTNDINLASDRFLKEYERPKNMNKASTINARRQNSLEAYNAYSGRGRAPGYYGNGRATSYYDNGKTPSYYGSGRAAMALNNIRSGRGNTTIVTAQPSSTSVDYITFLRSIIEILITISNNTALLNRILDVLSSKFGINIDASQVTRATNNATRDQAQRALDQLVGSNADASRMAKLINNKDTQYLLNAMAAIASE